MTTEQTRRSMDFMLDQQAHFTIDLQRLRDAFIRLERISRAQHSLRMETTEVLARALVGALERIDHKLKDMDSRIGILAARLAALEARME
jgi:hypothetical protein